MKLKNVFYNLITKNNITYKDINDALNNLSSSNIDYADLYFQSIFCECLCLENKIIKEILHNMDKGFSVRTIFKKRINFSYSNDISLKNLKKLVSKISNLNFNINKKEYIKHNNFIEKKISICENPIKGFSFEKKIEILNRINNIVRNYDKRVSNVIVLLKIKYEQIFIASIENNFSEDVRSIICLKITSIVEENSIIEKGVSGGSVKYWKDFFFNDKFLKTDLIKKWSIDSVRIAILNLQAKKAPSGFFPVVLGSGWPGILLHEAVGHGLEGDFNRKKISIYRNKIGSKVASKLCTVVDDGTISSGIGSLNIDDEGNKTNYNVLIKNGILKKYLQDKYNAMLMNHSLTGNARRESYKYIPYPRMTNTYMLPGNSNFEDIICSVDYGIYATNFSGGQVDVTSGNFVFTTIEAYLIKNGKICFPIKNVTLIGSGIDVMKNVSMVGNDFSLDQGLGICSKEGQNISVGVGQPTIKIKGLTVGGTN
ncbi:metalloprotease TldD [Buchnera aphidicola (Ceratoglyphina bambusae)]|uniref:metalloprotease TldD n=1 Tax=Buchnera aphidicola TaxID=9 RepID=UPI0031B880BC